MGHFTRRHEIGGPTHASVYTSQGTNQRNWFIGTNEAAIRRILLGPSLTMLRSLGLFVLAAGTIALAWYGLGRAVSMPPSPLGPGEKLTCISYAPFHGDQAPFTWNLRTPERQIAADLRRLSALPPAAGPIPKGARGHRDLAQPAVSTCCKESARRDRADNRR